MEKERDELKVVADEFVDFRVKSEERITTLEQRLKNAEKRAADETLRREEFEQDLQVCCCKDHKRFRVQIEHFSWKGTSVIPL